jgi:UDP-2-acetamido-3-amino-2,3-dideoxy-glucuronate N-acetyltransferase
VAKIHSTADVSPDAEIGEDTQIWHQAQVREGVKIGSECILGKGVYIDRDVQIGDRVKIQNYSCIYHGVTIEDGVFVGPHVVFTNDRFPRAVTPEGELKGDADWEVSEVLVKTGASIGANTVVLPGVTIGRYAMVGAGSVVTRDVLDHAVVFGNPALQWDFACRCGRPLISAGDGWACPACGRRYRPGPSGPRPCEE